MEESTERNDAMQAVPNVECGGAHEGHDTVTSLQLYDADTMYALRRLRRGISCYTLGSASDQDIVLPSRLLSPRYQTRVIALARSIGVATTALGQRYVKQMARVRLEPLSSRPGTIHRLLDQLFEKRGNSICVRAMALHNQAALVRHRWAQNFASLHEAADRLIAVAREPSLRRAALALGIPPTTFHHWYANIVRLKLPLLAGAHTLGDRR